jgi:hypothetical protein
MNSSAGQVYGGELEGAMERGCQFKIGQVSQIGIGEEFMVGQVVGEQRF